ncbi:MAG: hypothetical protein QM496_11635 [Verrucomicrobiota bacterium]
MTHQIELDFSKDPELEPEIRQTDNLKSSSPDNNSEPALRTVLFLQTDWEMGSCRLARQMRSHGHEVFKVAFHSADYYFRLWAVPVSPYRGKVETWKNWLKAHSEENGIDTYVLYNNKRTYNAIAEELADELGIEVITLEQGLIRPLHVTAYSTKQQPLEEIPELWQRSLSGNWIPEGYPTIPHQKVPVSSAYKFLRFGFFGMISALTRPLFPNYREQQQMGLLFHAKAQLRSLWRLLKSASNDRKIQSLISKDWERDFFLVPLQVPYDKQILLHSEFSDMNEFINKVAESFEREAGSNQKLIFKIHPVDRGYRDYTATITELKQRLGNDRIHLIDRVNLDQLLENAQGVVTINSTLGLTALRHGTPVKALGQAIYDLKELTFRSSLDNFWKSKNRPCMDTVQLFVKVLESTIQGRGTLSRRCFTDAEETGIIWPKNICNIFDFREY